MVKNPPTNQEMQVRSLGWEDPLEKEMAIHSSILAWEIPWTEEPGGIQSMGSQRVGHNLVTKELQQNPFTYHSSCRMSISKHLNTMQTPTKEPLLLRK